jgi:hypothetical protein
MTSQTIKPRNSVLLIALQSAEGVAATPSPTTDAVPFESDSVDFNSPFKTEDSNETTGSFDAGAPLVLGQAATFSFKSRLKGAGATYTSSVKPPLHAALQACSWLGQFTAGVAAAALTAGTAASATLGTGFSSTAQAYRGMPLLLTGSPADGRMPLVSDYSTGKVAKLTDLYGSALSTGNQGAIPANWTYFPTSPATASERASMTPLATIYYYEDGILWKWMDCRGIVDLDGASARPGISTFNFTGVYMGRQDADVPSNAVFPRQSAPLLVQGSSAAPAIQIAGKPLPISTWSIKTGGQAESPDDPNTYAGFGGAQLSDRSFSLEIDPLMTLTATRDILADIGAFSQYAGGLQLGGTAGNRVSILLPLLQPVDSTAAMRGKLRSERQMYRPLNPGRDAAGRDGTVGLCFS